ncbi:hypothetical protein [Acidovorax cavernicola]|uniref:Uncharacterized protein n=1 Tax=Acidovorax cavernicola TaxID=1675792 RepID=A0A9X8D4D2_9BURK|nr:hypothetical protein [Acidovorax cavernicola]RIX79110.1 hypothetical protein D3H34_15330 [Acidovorax cavernicola]
MFNPWKQLENLVSGPPRQAGVVLSIVEGISTIELPGGGRIQAVGVAEAGLTVFVRGGVIEGEAAGDLPIDIIEI